MFKRATFYILTISFCVLVFNSCYFDNEERLYPNLDSLNSTCSDSVITYSNHITSILNNYCYSCHGTSNFNERGNGINLQGFNNLKKYADNGRLWGAVNHDPGYIPMPDGAAKLNGCNLSQIKQWIDEGGVNN